MTDPQNDVPCRDCKRPTQHDTERCDDCRTPAGRLVTALREILPDIEGIEAEHGRSAVSVGCLTIEVDEDGRWTIEGHTDDGIAPEDAIAAIAQAPGLRAERDTLAAENARLRAELEKPVARAWSQSEVTDRAFRDAGDLAAAVRMEVVEDGPPWGWCIWSQRAHERIASGPDTGDAGRHAADLALVAAGYRLIGGVHPLPSEVSNAR